MEVHFMFLVSGDENLKSPKIIANIEADYSILWIWVFSMIYITIFIENWGEETFKLYCYSVEISSYDAIHENRIADYETVKENSRFDGELRIMKLKLKLECFRGYNKISAENSK